MEETDIIDSHTPVEPQGLLLLPEAQDFLLETGKWARFLGVIAYISAALVVLCGLFFATFMSAISRLPTATSTMPKFFGSWLGVLYILIGVFHFFVGRYLHQFGTKVKEGVSYQDTDAISTALGKLKSLFKLGGITTIVVLSLYVLIIVGVIIGAIIGFSMVRPA
jgi:small-conductance mechanosensitive channel